MQLVGAQCGVCDTRIVLDADGERCGACAAVLHRSCRESACPACGTTTAFARGRVVASRCPACSRSTGDSADLVCRFCGARTAWDDADELQRYQAECRSQANAFLVRGALHCFLACLIVFVAWRLGIGGLVVGGLVVIGFVIIPLLAVAILFAWWAIRSLHAGWSLSRPIHLCDGAA